MDQSPQAQIADTATARPQSRTLASHEEPPADDRPTIGSMLRRSARQYGKLPCIIDGDRAVSFMQFDQEVDRLAGALLAAGIGKGDHIGIWLPNSYEWILAFCAAARAGAVVVPVNTRYKADEARYVIQQSDIKLLFMLHRMWKTDYYETFLSLAPELAGQESGELRLEAFPSLRTVVMAGDGALSGTVTLPALLDRADMSGLAAAQEAVDWRDTLLISYTSGTTGQPKGVMHGHGVIRQSTKVGLAMHVVAGDCVLAHMPFYHSAGLFMGLIPALSLGAALVPMAQWDADRALDLIDSQGVTMFGGIPTHYYDLVDAIGRRPRNTSSLKGAWIGGAAVMQETFERIKRTLALDRLLSTYGMTENTISTSFNAWDDPAEVCCRNNAPLLSDCEVRIVDPASGEPVPAGQEGEVWCRGDTVMVGYYKDPASTAATMTEDGWLKTGDIGVFDDRGYLSITGRLKEMLKIGGTNTSPIEIEQYLAGHPHIRSSVVVGVPDERLGQVPYAFVQTVADASLSRQDVIDYCSARIASYKVPRFIRFIEEFPRTETGKIKRAVMAKMAASELEGQ